MVPGIDIVLTGIYANFASGPHLEGRLNTQHNDTQNNDTQHKEHSAQNKLRIITLIIITLSIA